MSKYFVSPNEETDLRIDALQLTDAIARRWPGANIQTSENPDDVNSVTWSVPMSHGELEGALERAGQAIIMDGHVVDAAEFARWARQQIPERYRLYFYNEAYTADVPLMATTPVDELVKPFLVRG